MRPLLAGALIAAIVAIASGCGSGNEPKASSSTGNPAAITEPYRPPIRPADFVSKVSNPYYPLLPGTVTRFEGMADGEREVNVVTVTDQKKKIMGVETTVVDDRVYGADGALKEKTSDWFAQDRFGNVWYFGEDTKEYEDGKVKTTAGSWTAGVNGRPGIIMFGKPRVGLSYRQEYSPNNAVDSARIVDLDAKISVPYGSFEPVLVTEEWSPLEKDVLDRKYYARRTGLILEKRVRGGDEISRLVKITEP